MLAQAKFFCALAALVGVGFLCSSALAQPGGCNTNGDCDDNDVCTVDICGMGQCQSVLIVDCCIIEADCDDGSICTADRCNLVTNRCEVIPIVCCCTGDSVCDDGQVCTIDTCNPVTLCCESARIPDCCELDADCDTGDICITSTCDTQTNMCSTPVPILGCCHDATDCDDSDICTDDYCGSNVCTNTPKACCCTSDGDCPNGACSVGRCNPLNRCCEAVPISDCCTTSDDCDTGDICTTSACDIPTGTCSPPVAIPGCCHDATDCGDLLCYDETCVDNQCLVTPRTCCCTVDSECDDGDPCTVDTCAGTFCCENTPIAGCSIDAGVGGTDAADSGGNDASPSSNGRLAVASPDGCGCRTAERLGGKLPVAGLVLLLLLGAVLGGRTEP